jgi:hypothetical protein
MPVPAVMLTFTDFGSAEGTFSVSHRIGSSLQPSVFGLSLQFFVFSVEFRPSVVGMKCADFCHSYDRSDGRARQSGYEQEKNGSYEGID